MNPREISAIFENQSTFWRKRSVFCSSAHSDSSPNKNPKIGNSDPPLSTKLLVEVLNGAHFLKKCIFLFELKSRCLEGQTVEAHRCREGSAWVWLLSRDVWEGNQSQRWGSGGSLLLAFGRLTKTTSDISPSTTSAGVVPSPEAYIIDMAGGSQLGWPDAQSQKS